MNKKDKIIWEGTPINKFQEENKKRMDDYKLREQLTQAHETIGELTKRILDLQYTNVRLFTEAVNLKKLLEVYAARLSQYNDPKPLEDREYTAADLKFLKALGIQP